MNEQKKENKENKSVKPENKHIIERDRGKFAKGCSGNPLGRPFGSVNKKTIEQNIVAEEFRSRVLFNVYELLTAQMNVAKGTSYLYRIEDSEGKDKKRKHVLVTNPEEIRMVLDELEGGGDVLFEENYYYITTKDPDNRAIDSLFDRVLGKATTPIDLSSGGLPLGIVFLPRRNKDNEENVKLETSTKTSDSSN